MPVLGVDTSGRLQSVAVASEGRILAGTALEASSSHSSTLLRSVDHVLSAAGLTIRGLTAIAVTTGPGAFTGLRVGMATAKGLALAAGVRLAGCSTLRILAEALAAIAASPSGAPVCALLDAGRGQVFKGLYGADPCAAERRALARVGDESLCDPEEALEGLEAACLFGGDGAARCVRALPPSGRASFEARCIETVPPLAPVLALIVEAEGRLGLPGSAAFVPNYVRGAAARPPHRP